MRVGRIVAKGEVVEGNVRLDLGTSRLECNGERTHPRRLRFFSHAWTAREAAVDLM